LITDCLNTHQSESLVRLVAEIEGLEFDLGIKGESGILKSMKTRAFLSDSSCCLSLHPKHSSWLNQIEIWFSILVRKLLLRASFISKDDLKARVLDFIDYFNRTMAKPLSGLIKVRYWQFNGKGIYAASCTSACVSPDYEVNKELCDGLAKQVVGIRVPLGLEADRED